MKIFYLNKNEILNSLSLETLEKYSDDRIYKSKEKYIEHLLGLFLVKTVAKNIYKLSDTKIILKNGKPYFISGEIYFSISHSKDIVLAAFNNTNIGTDVEFMCPRDYGKVLKRYKIDIKNPTKQNFYKFWTNHEACIKLGNSNPKSIFCGILENDYAFCCVSEDIMITNCTPVKLSF